MKVSENCIYQETKPTWFFKEKQKFSQKALLQFYVDDDLPSAPLQFGTLLDNKYLVMQHKRGQNTRKL